ncbi:MAG: hypothetical protein WHV66_04690 [Anaerolineales bacterium]
MTSIPEAISPIPDHVRLYLQWLCGLTTQLIKLDTLLIQRQRQIKLCITEQLWIRYLNRKDYLTIISVL